MKHSFVEGNCDTCSKRTTARQISSKLWRRSNFFLYLLWSYLNKNIKFYSLGLYKTGVKLIPKKNLKVSTFWSILGKILMWISVRKPRATIKCSIAFAWRWLQGNLEKQKSLQNVVCPHFRNTKGRKWKCKGSYKPIMMTINYLTPVGLGTWMETQFCKCSPKKWLSFFLED